MGWVSFVATDAHNMINRKPRMEIAYKNICMKLNPETARMVCIENPIRLIEGTKITSDSLNQNLGYLNAERNADNF